MRKHNFKSSQRIFFFFFNSLVTNMHNYCARNNNSKVNLANLVVLTLLYSFGIYIKHIRCNNVVSGSIASQEED